MIELVREVSGVTAAKLSETAGISERTIGNIKRTTKLLQDAGIVERVGFARKGIG